MSNIRVNTITDEVGTGAPDFPNGYTVAGAVPAAPESGVQTFTATGTLANGDLVGVNPDGTVSVVSPYTGDSVDVNTSLSYFTCSTFDTLNNKVVVFYRNGTTLFLEAVVGTISGTTISFGTPVVAASVNAHYNSCTFDPVNNKVVVVIRNLTSSTCQALVGTVSGTSISFGTAVTVYAADVFYSTATFDSLNNKVVVSYKVTVSPNAVYARVGTVSGTTISFGAQATVAASSDTGQSQSATFDSTNGKLVFAVQAQTTGIFNLIVGTVSGTSISFGAAVPVTGSYVSGSVAHDTSLGKVLFVYSKSDNSVASVLATVTGTTVTISSEFPVYAPWVLGGVSSLVNIGNGTFLSSIVHTTILVRRLLRVTASSVSMLRLDQTTVSAGSVASLSIDPVSKTVVQFYKKTATNVASLVVDPTSTVNSWVGIAAEAIADGASGKITVTGGINSGQAGLVTGVQYGYDTSTGALTLGLSNIGIALSPTQLYIK